MTSIRLITPITIALTLAFNYSAAAQETSAATAASEEKLNRIEQKIDRLVETANKQDKAYLDQPLGDRTQGVEFNFFRLLSIGQEATALSGTYSLFNTQNNTEIAFPIMFSQSEHEGYLDNKNMTSFTADAHYRKYLGERLDGFYLSGFTRIAHLSGVLGKDDYSYYYSSDYGSTYERATSKTGSETKIGIGFGIGYRIISTNGFYWGASLSLGRYLIGDSDKFYESEGASTELDDEEIIIDIELLKFGYAF